MAQSYFLLPTPNHIQERILNPQKGNKNNFYYQRKQILKHWFKDGGFIAASGSKSYLFLLQNEIMKNEVRQLKLVSLDKF